MATSIDSVITKQGTELAAETTPINGQLRLESLDVIRGLTIAGMILVNSPGTWRAIK
jgi:predicted acyltransferase